MIKLENVSKKYKTGVHALNDLSLEIGKGEFVYIVGKTGSGKSTLIKIINKEENVNSGNIVVANTDLKKLKRGRVPYYRRNLGVIFQDYRLLPKKTVFENIAFALEVVDTPKVEIRKRVRELLKLVELEDKAKCYPDQISGGQQQRVVIARAIANRPKVIIADEPTGNLDPEKSIEILELLEKINREEGATILMVTHDRYIVNTKKHRTIKLNGGCVEFDKLEGGYEDND